MIRQFLRDYQKKRRQKRLKSQTADEVFTRIYRGNKWRGAESRSGKGSDMEQTETVRSILPGLFSDLKIASMVDLPCGDFNWMQHVELNGVHYIGADIVPDLIAANACYAKSNIEFRVLNLLTDDLPKADLYMVRDCLVHLSFLDIEKAMKQLLASKSAYLLTTTFPDEDVNGDIMTGEWRRLNLCQAPFNLPKPIKVFTENGDVANPDKSMGLWKISDIETA